MSNHPNVLEELDFGAQVAEDEEQALADYFVETETWRLLVSGAVDVVYGAKGAGKSALYGTVISHARSLREASRIVIIAGENVRGTPVFSDLAADPPGGDYRIFWKLYIACLVATELSAEIASSREGLPILEELRTARLIPDEPGIRGVLRAVARYVRNLTQGSALKTAVTLDPVTNAPELSTTLQLQPIQAAVPGIRSADDVLRGLDTVVKSLGSTAWVLLDRLDVAFEDAGIEDIALAALFRTYLDMSPLSSIRLKVFIRADIWERITSARFPEASHITRETTIAWDQPSLINLVVRRIVRTPAVREYFNVQADEVLASEFAQRELLRRLLPPVVTTTSARTVDATTWMFAVTKDGFGHNAPRELLHLLREARTRELARRGRGAPAPESEALLSHGALKDALHIVSKARLEKTICAEYPNLAEYIQSLKAGMADLSVSDLADLWALSAEEALAVARQLVNIGFFSVSGSKRQLRFVVPPLHAEALELANSEF